MISFAVKRSSCSTMSLIILLRELVDLGSYDSSSYMRTWVFLLLPTAANKLVVISAIWSCLTVAWLVVVHANIHRYFTTALLNFFLELVSSVDLLILSLLSWMCCCSWRWSSYCCTVSVTLTKKLIDISSNILLLVNQVIVLASLILLLRVLLSLQRWWLSLLPDLRSILTSMELVLVVESWRSWPTFGTHHAINCGT